MNEIKQGVNDLARSNNEIMNAIGSRLFYAVNDSTDLEFPYSVFSFQPITESRIAGTRISDFICQFSVYDNVESSANIGSISDMIIKLFDGCEQNITIANSLVLSFKFFMQRELPYDSQKVWTSIIQFKVKLQKGE